MDYISYIRKGGGEENKKYQAVYEYLKLIL